MTKKTLKQLGYEKVKLADKRTYLMVKHDEDGNITLYQLNSKNEAIGKIMMHETDLKNLIDIL